MQNSSRTRRPPVCGRLQPARCNGARRKGSPSPKSMKGATSLRATSQPLASIRLRQTRAVGRAVRVLCEAEQVEWEFIVDEQSGIEYKMLASKMRSVEVPGFGTWAYREGVPPVGSPDVECEVEKDYTVLMIHGAGLTSYTYRNMMSFMAEKGFRCVVPDLPGHGDTTKLPVSQFDYSEGSYISALEAFVTAAGLDNPDKPLVLVTQGFITSQYAMLLAAKRPELFARVLIMNTPLMPGHNLPGPLNTFTLPFVGKRASAAADALAANGNFYGMGYRDAQVFQAPYEDPDTKEDARVALMTTVTSQPMKDLLTTVDRAYEGFMNPVLVLWGDSDKYLNSKTFYDWCIEKGTNVKFKVLQTGHMPQEDYAGEAAAQAMEFFEKEI